MKKRAVLRIEFLFGKGLDKTVEKARASGENETVQTILDKLVQIYSEEIKRNADFTASLRKLDPNMMIRVSSSIVGE